MGTGQGPGSLDKLVFWFVFHEARLTRRKDVEKPPAKARRTRRGKDRDEVVSSVSSRCYQVRRERANWVDEARLRQGKQSEQFDVYTGLDAVY